MIMFCLLNQGQAQEGGTFLLYIILLYPLIFLITLPFSLHLTSCISSAGANSELQDKWLSLYSLPFENVYFYLQHENLDNFQ